MSEDRSSNGQNGADEDHPRRSWLKRLRQLLHREPKDRGQLVDLLRDAEQRNLLDAEALSIIEGALQVSKMQVRDITIPRNQVTYVERDAKPEDYLPILIESGHSRFPVIGENKDEVMGILLAKDLLHYFAKADKETFNIRDVLRPAVFVPESKRLDVLLKEFRSSRNHMAIVVDEYGGVDGLVTIEDVLEQIVGEIEDEHDIDQDIFILKRNDETYTVKAVTPIDEFNQHFATNFSDEEFDTVGGLVINRFGCVPQAEESINIGSLNFAVIRADRRRIHLLRVSQAPAVSSEDAAQDEVDSPNRRVG
jgi:magnesium and cobalt transporter